MLLILSHLVLFVSLRKPQGWDFMIIFQTQDLEKYSIRSLPRPYTCMYIIFDVFTLRVRGDAKIISILLPPRVTWYIGYYECNEFLKMATLTTGSLPSDYHGGQYSKDDVSVCMFKCMFLPSLWVSQCYLRELAASLLFMTNLWIFMEVFKTFRGYLRHPSISVNILLVTCGLGDLLITDIFLLYM